MVSGKYIVCASVLVSGTCIGVVLFYGQLNEIVFEIRMNSWSHDFAFGCTTLFGLIRKLFHVQLSFFFREMFNYFVSYFVHTDD